MRETRIELAEGALSSLPEHIPPHEQLFVVADPVLRLPLAAYPHVHLFPGGEAHKTWEKLGEMLEAMDRARLDRDGHVLAVGGGVLTDMAGLAASLHRRGTAWTAAPTTLIGQVDAALGGKTAVNLAGGKNTAGTFHPPERLLVDPAVLASLPARELSCGMAEALKTAIIAGEELLARVERASAPPGSDIIAACLATKQRIVQADPEDHGPRRTLNLGHTFAHALEAVSRWRLRHGEAVGLGLLCASRLAGASALEERVRAALRRWGLPTSCELEPRAVLEEMRRDKKRRGGATIVVLPRAPGRVEIEACELPEALLAALQAIR